MAWYVPLNPTTSKVRVSLRKLSGVPNQTGRSICPRGWTRLPGAMPPQLVQPDPEQAQSVHVEDVEAAASVHQHLGEPGVPDDGVDHQRILEGPIR
jgi:hypothetical protein